MIQDYKRLHNSNFQGILYDGLAALPYSILTSTQAATMAGFELAGQNALAVNTPTLMGFFMQVSDISSANFAEHVFTTCGNIVPMTSADPAVVPFFVRIEAPFGYNANTGANPFVGISNASLYPIKCDGIGRGISFLDSTSFMVHTDADALPDDRVWMGICFICTEITTAANLLYHIGVGHVLEDVPVFQPSK